MYLFYSLGPQINGGKITRKIGPLQINSDKIKIMLNAISLLRNKLQYEQPL